ncbi:MAG: MgtC/SapB family protein [Candidatus Aenigmarchaeota archaeon]|nr:MgtC/SapB family protein [Candidatus Aenigmarchaeota archaeon]MDI6721929.1 MgtC/SapB family protein [Candidatus Aenigmarchaeota archaeon]
MVTPIETEIIIKLIVAATIGMLIGLERELHRKPAGMRTHALVCIGATLFTIMSFSFAGENVDTSRIAANIVMGIGFLGAGIVFRAEDRVKGITTAAEMWVLAAIGISIGIGMYYAAAVATIIVLAILWPAKLLEKKVVRKR